MKKKLLSAVMALAMMATIIVVPTVSQAAITKDEILGSWYGQYTGSHSTNSVFDGYVERYMNMTIEEIDDDGNFTGVSYVTTVEGQGYDDHWFNYECKGTVDFTTNEFFMQGTKITEQNSGTNWTLVPFTGTLSYNDSGELTVTGIAKNNEEQPFYFARVSDWAKTEVTDANALGLMPATMQGKDMSKPITRAEFAAVAVCLYEALAETEVQSVSTPFTDIAGNVDEESVQKAYGLNIAIGTSDTEFEPDTEINREQLATMLCRTIKKQKFAEWTYETDSEYFLDTAGVKLFDDDNEISDYAKASVYYMVKMGIINGIDDTHFAPQNMTDEQEANGYATATREQAIALSLRIYKLSDIWQ